MNSKGKEINRIVFSNSLNTSYLEEKDLYIYRNPGSSSFQCNRRRNDRRGAYLGNHDGGTRRN